MPGTTAYVRYVPGVFGVRGFHQSCVSGDPASTSGMIEMFRGSTILTMIPCGHYVGILAYSRPNLKP